jgi:hypothetical protein
MTEKAEKLYQACISNANKPDVFRGLPTRAYNIIRHKGITTREALYEEVESGRIVKERGVGVGVLEDICEWLCKQEEK